LASLIRELLALQEQNGWLDDAALRRLAEQRRVPLHRLESLTTFYPHFRRRPPQGRRIAVCRDLSCALAGGAEALARLREQAASAGDVEITEISCPGRCDRAPAAIDGEQVFRTDDPEACRRALSTEDVPARPPPPLEGLSGADPYASAADRFSALRRLRSQAGAASIAELDAAGLRGMGGAAFPTGRKWSLVAGESSPSKVVICNADESEPGTFKDREILRSLGHLVVEGMALAGHAVGAARGIVFIRHEYEPERESLERAIGEARAAGAIGPAAGFDVEVFVSPGGYILGEETALLECLEDRRGEPRNKPPYPGNVGLHGRPTLINNVETFVHATAIAARGAEWWRSLGVRGGEGHKLISVSGDVARPGVELVPFGSTFGELLERCGGLRDGRRLLAFAPGGASSRFLGADSLDVRIDWGSVAEAGSMLGSGAVVFVGEGHDLRELGLSITRFFRNESCGKCVPCRLGTEQAVALVESAGGVDEALRSRLAGLHETLERTSLCGLGQVALAPLLSLCERFPERMRGD